MVKLFELEQKKFGDNEVLQIAKYHRRDPLTETYKKIYSDIRQTEHDIVKLKSKIRFNIILSVASLVMGLISLVLLLKFII